MKDKKQEEGQENSVVSTILNIIYLLIATGLIIGVIVFNYGWGYLLFWLNPFAEGNWWAIWIYLFLGGLLIGLIWVNHHNKINKG